MPEYRVISATTELPQNTMFTTINTFPIEDGELVLLSIDGRLTIGRWHQNLCGLNWIKQPGRWIPIIGTAMIVVMGLIVLIRTTPR
jgi:hypothetical protein